MPNIGVNADTNKVRIYDNTLNSSNLYFDRRNEKKSSEYAPIDSNKVMIGFSPINVLNKDIMAYFGDTDYNDYIGDPRDYYEDSYHALESASAEYFQQYQQANNF